MAVAKLAVNQHELLPPNAAISDLMESLVPPSSKTALPVLQIVMLVPNGFHRVRAMHEVGSIENHIVLVLGPVGLAVPKAVGNCDYINIISQKMS